MGLTVDFDLLKDETRSHDGVYELKAIDTFATQDHRHMLQVIDHEIAPSTNSIFTIKLIQHWLSSCQENHTSCQPTNLQYPLPLRVIDVGTIGQSSVRLLVSDSSPEYGSYITLSHCWGKSNIMKLTIENESALRAGFGIQDLPKTFRHAIQVTRALSVKYLWIDSLCILQNSVDDWRHQSALMGEIYRNCFCNIAATSSHNSDGGLFTEREPHLLKPLNLTIKWKIGGGLTRQGRYYLWDSDLWGCCVRDAPVNRRGWVLQERLLAPRVLHFTSKFIFWECKTMAASEIIPTGQPLSIPYIDEDFYTSLTRTIEELSTKEHEPVNEKEDLIRSAHKAWWQLVYKYSTCPLTKDDDILAAISGIANVMEKALNDKYHGGLWRSTILEGLLWQRSRRLIRPTLRPFPFRAPTWSWASMKGQISLAYPSIQHAIDERTFVFLAEIMDVQIESAGTEENVQIENGYLSILGSLFDVAVPKAGKPVLKIEHYDFAVFMFMDDTDWWPVCREKGGTNVICMPILLTSGLAVQLCGLVIELVSYGPLEGHFVRIGIFRSDISVDSEDSEDIRFAFNEEEKKIIVLG